MKKYKSMMMPLLILLLMVLLLIGLLAAIHMLTNSQTGQQAASRWAEGGKAAAQISVFATEKAKLDEEDVFILREKLNAAMTEADLIAAKDSADTSEAKKKHASGKNANTDNNGTASSDIAAPYIDCYSAKGKLSLSTDRTSADFTAYGVGGNFFFFHPLTLKGGAYFSENSMMDDYIILDEDSAWQLFGSTDIAGMEVCVGQTPLVVAGVVARENTFFSEAAGNTKPTVFVSYNTLLTLGSTTPISCYEIVLPNLTKGYAKNLVKENLDIKSSRRAIVENSSRYSFSGLIGTVNDFGRRSMQKKPLVYPYWENQARAVEDVCILLLFFCLIDLVGLLTLMIIKGVIPLVRFIKNRRLPQS